MAAAYDRAEFETLLTTGQAPGGRKINWLMETAAKENASRLTPGERDPLHAYLVARAKSTEPLGHERVLVWDGQQHILAVPGPLFDKGAGWDRSSRGETVEGEIAQAVDANALDNRRLQFDGKAARRAFVAMPVRSALLLVPALATLAVRAMAQPAASADANTTALAFLDAFRQMDTARFDAIFAPDVTMFFPDGPFPAERTDGRAPVLKALHAFFASLKQQGRTELVIHPLDLGVQAHGDIAIFTSPAQRGTWFLQRWQGPLWICEPDGPDRRQKRTKKVYSTRQALLSQHGRSHPEAAALSR